MTDNDRDKNKDILLREKIKQINTISHEDFQTFVTHVKPTFSLPLTIDYIDRIKVGLMECVTKEDKHKWEIIHQFQSLHDGVKICGRFMKFLVVNETDNTLLGLIRFNLFRPRIRLVNEMIGWSNETKYNQKMSQKVVNLQTLVPTQPFGYNCLGGKLLTLLSTSEEILNLWKQRYGEVFSLITMSLTSGVCQYSGLKTFRHIGNIIGESKIERGIYLCNLYENSLSLLRNETTIPNGELKTIHQITDEWKVLSKKRMTTLVEQNRLSNESNTYDGYYVQ